MQLGEEVLQRRYVCRTEKCYLYECLRAVFSTTHSQELFGTIRQPRGSGGTMHAAAINFAQFARTEAVGHMLMRVCVLTAFCSPLSLLAANDFWKFESCWHTCHELSLQETNKKVST